jgi:hypothetical protein
MSTREANMIWLKDILDQIQQRQQTLQWTEDRETIRVLTESMLRDLDVCRKLCETLHQRALPQSCSA